MSELHDRSETNNSWYSGAESHLRFEDAPGFVSELPSLPPHVVYKRNRELLPMLLRLQRTSRFDRPRCYVEFVYKGESGTG